MLVRRWFRLCTACNRHAHFNSEITGWRTRRGHQNLQYKTVLNVTSGRLCHNDVGDLYKYDSVQRYVRQLTEEHIGLTEKLQHAHVSDSERKDLIKRHAELLPVSNAIQIIQKALNDLDEVVSLMRGTAEASEEDELMTQLLKEEEAQISEKIEALKKDLIRTLLPSDPQDSSNVLLEVMSGRTTGGDICQQFTREMFDMYQGFACYKNWTFEVFNYSAAEYGGLHHAAVRVAGQDVYRHLKYEGGTHRVQRIPEVGLSSRMQRIHTGTMTVIILPQPTELDFSIDTKDLRIDTFKSRGAGGQSVNTTDSAVRIVHLPTGTTAECQQSRSQLKNRETAMGLLRARLYQSIMGKETEQRQTSRKQQVGTRSQSERIRTYNFSQDRVTDHRTGYVTRDIKAVMLRGPSVLFQEFMRGGEALDELISDVLHHSERDSLLDLVESNPGLKQPEPAQSTD